MILPKRVWLVVILLTAAVVSLLLLFIKKELRLEAKLLPSLSEAFGLNRFASSSQALDQTRQLLDDQAKRWQKVIQYSPPSVQTSTAATTTGQ